MSTGLDEEFLGKLARIADGALHTIAEREREEILRTGPRGGGAAPPAGTTRQFWEGYRQAVEDMTDQVRRRGAAV